MVCNFNGRYIYSGWVSGKWASLIVVRELLQRPDGRLDIRWLKEQCPDIDDARNIDCAKSGDIEISINPHKRTYIEFNINPKNAKKAAVRVCDKNSLKKHELQFDFENEQVQWNTLNDGNKFAETLLPIHKIAKIRKQNPSDKGRLRLRNFTPDTLHYNGNNFALANVDVMKSPFKVRMFIKNDGGNCIVDTEVAERRTILSQRRDVLCDKIIISSDGISKISDIKIKEFSE